MVVNEDGLTQTGPVCSPSERQRHLSAPGRDVEKFLPFASKNIENEGLTDWLRVIVFSDPTTELFVFDLGQPGVNCLKFSLGILYGQLVNPCCAHSLEVTNEGQEAYFDGEYGRYLGHSFPAHKISNGIQRGNENIFLHPGHSVCPSWDFQLVDKRLAQFHRRIALPWQSQSSPHCDRKYFRDLYPLPREDKRSAYLA
jgi:hypothetical protein